MWPYEYEVGPQHQGMVAPWGDIAGRVLVQFERSCDGTGDW